MSELPRIMPIPGASIPPVRPIRRPGREPRRNPERDPKPARPPPESDEESNQEAPDPTAIEDEPAKGGSINLHV